ncbi:Ferrous iron transport protein A [Kaistella daneshvariae]
MPFKILALKRDISDKLCCFPRKKMGKIIGYENKDLIMPNKIIEMGLLPETVFKVLYQAPFKGPLYIEFGDEKSRIALREEEARFIIVESLT